MKEMLRKTSKKIVAVVAATVLVMTLGLSVSFAETAYTTESFDVNAKVNEDHTIDMTETITVNFNEARHGIYRNIPYKSSVYKINHIKVDGESYDVSTDYSDGVSQKVIQIGDADETVTGTHVYTINYTMVGYKDNSEALDYFALDVIPTSWESAIKDVKVTLTMPKSFQWDDMEVFKGSYGDRDQKYLIKYNYDTKGNVAIITGENLPANYGISMQCDLPEGYWVNPADNTWVIIPMAIAMGIIPVLVLLMWAKWGRDPKIVKTVEFYAPEDMTPAEIGYIIDGSVDLKDMISMIMYFADKGYLTIEEIDKDKFQLTKVSDISSDEKTFAATFFNGLFAGGQTVQMDNLPESFADSFQVAKEQLKGYYSGKNRLFTIGSRVCRIIGCFFMMIPAVLAVLFSAYASLKFGYAFAAIPVFLILAIGLITVMVTFDKRESIEKGKIAGRMIFGCICIILSVGGASIITGILTQKWWLAIEMVAAMVITYLFALLMNARTKKAAQWQGKILGFKNFIKSAELEKLKALVEEDPAYFYNVMPYAYVMGLSDKWAKKFEKIPQSKPNWYYGDSTDMLFNVMWMNHMMRGCYHSMASAMMPEISTGDSGDSGFGGGFGGGGFSGGGFGGGGGGAW